jgi:hypothetical protein
MNRIKQFFSRHRLYAELDEEMTTHLEQRVEELVGEGMTKEQAQAKARREFGNVTAIKRTAREAWGWKGMEDLFVDLRFGLRMLKKNPVITLAAVLTLALGIGANTAIFTLLYGLVLRSLPAANPGQLAKVGLASRAQPDDADNFGSAMTYHMLQAYREEQTSFRELSSWDNGEVLVPDKEGVIQRYMSEMVSGNAFELLGLQPYRGRLIAPYDDVKDGPSTGWPVVLSYGFWKDYYGGAEDIIGKKMIASDVPVTIVGVTPPDFYGVWPGTQPKMYFPMQFEPVMAKRPDWMDEKGEDLFVVAVIGRLRPGVNLKQANAEMAQLQGGLLDRFIPAKLKHDPYIEQAYLMVGSARSGLPGWFAHLYRKPLYLMQGLVVIVLLLCCVNIGGLMMSRCGSAAGVRVENSSRGVPDKASTAISNRKFRHCDVRQRVGCGGCLVRKRSAAAFLPRPDDDGTDLGAPRQDHFLGHSRIRGRDDAAVRDLARLEGVENRSRESPQVPNSDGWATADRRTDVRARAGGFVPRVGRTGPAVVQPDQTARRARGI